MNGGHGLDYPRSPEPPDEDEYDKELERYWKAQEMEYDFLRDDVDMEEDDDRDD